jgi:hypothetical protein
MMTFAISAPVVKYQRNTTVATNRQIQCINRTTRTDPHERISHVGGVENSKAWKMTLDQAIAAKEAGTYNFYTSVGGKSVWVIIALHLGRKYLKTEADGVHPDNLLALANCP